MMKFFIVAFMALCLVVIGALSINAAEVNILDKKETWQLLIDGTPFYIKGVGCGLGVGKNGEDYLKLAKELGANCVRTWGIDQGTKEYLDKAYGYGLMVDAGIWLKWPSAQEEISYIGKNAYKREARKEALDYVKKFKNHPAILMWNVGNEVLFFLKSEEEKIAFCNFLESLVQKIHRIDPKHPIIYTCAAHLNLKYLKEYVPSLDAIGMNVYSTIRMAHGNWSFLEFNKPYIITEYGPYLPSDSRRDSNGKAVEPGDYQKASIYRNYTSQIQSFKGHNLGGFVFHLGETTQESMTWWNINEGQLKRQSYWAIYKVYTGDPPPYAAPRILILSLSKTKSLNPGEAIDVEVKMENEDINGLSFEYLLSTALEGVLQYYVNQYIAVEVIGQGNKVKIKVPTEKGIYRLYCFVKDNKGNVSSVNQTISVR